MNFAIQGSSIFIPLLGAQLGASDFQIGLIGAAYGGTFLLASLYSGRQSDRQGKLAFVRAGLLLCTATFAAQVFAGNLFTLILARGSVGLALGMTLAALIASAYETGSDMGKFSSYGSLGWIAGALAAALLKQITWLFGVSAVCCLAAFIASLFLPPQHAKKGGERKAPRLGKALQRGLPVYFTVFLRHLGATAVWIILPVYFASLGISRFWIGLLWGINFAVQFIVMRYLGRFNPRRVFVLGQVLSVMTFLAYAMVRNLWPLMAVQVLLGVSWSCLYMGALLLVLEVSEDKGTASGIFQATLNLCAAAGPFLGGLIAQGWGYRGVLIFAAALGLIGIIASLTPKKQARVAAAEK